MEPFLLVTLIAFVAKWYTRSAVTVDSDGFAEERTEAAQTILPAVTAIRRHVVGDGPDRKPMISEAHGLILLVEGGVNVAVHVRDESGLQALRDAGFTVFRGIVDRRGLTDPEPRQPCYLLNTISDDAQARCER